MAKMASLEAEQREVPWEYVVWRRFFVIALGVWLVSAISVITLLVFIYNLISDSLVTGLSTAFTVMS